MSRTGRPRLRRFFVLVALLVPAAAAAVALAARPVTGEIRVNATTDGPQEDPAVAMYADGDFAVAWETPDADLEGIVLRRFSGGGAAVTDELAVNPAPGGDQDDPAISSNGRDDLAVAWDVGDEAVKARLFPAAGRPSSEIEVNAAAGGFHESAAVAIGADGDFVVVWTSLGGDGHTDVLARTFDGRAAPRLPDDIRVNTTPDGDQQQAAVAMNAGGDFVVAWESLAQVAGDVEIFARRYSAAGRPQGGEIPITATRAGDQLAPAVAIDRDGGFVVVWEGSDVDGTGIVAQRFDAAGAAVGRELAVNETTTGDQFRPTVDMDGEGRWVAGWEGNGPGDADGVFVREFNAAGAPASGEERVNTSTSFVQERASVAVDAEGGYVATWQSEESALGGLDVFARRFAPASSQGTGQPVIRRLRLSAARRGRAVIATVGCISAVCKLRGSGAVSVRNTGRAKTFRLRGDSTTLRRGRGRLVLRLSRRALRAAVRGAERRRRAGRPVRAKVTVVGTDAAGGRNALVDRIRFKPRRASRRRR